MRKCDFSADELGILSDGMLSLLSGIETALKATYDSKAIEALKAAQNKYTKLNSKICGMMEE